MSHFTDGDRVEFISGSNKGRRGTVVNHTVDDRQLCYVSLDGIGQNHNDWAGLYDYQLQHLNTLDLLVEGVSDG